jgi:XTP/dITP diphosphohydrolase
VSDRTTLVVATSNKAKLAELRAMLEDLPIELLGLSDVLGEKLTIAEDGATFEENAVHKARVAASATMMLTLADDSGLEVDSLGGRPGVRSARFAGPRATDAENNAALLGALGDVEQRVGRFRCVLALVDPWAPPGTEPIVVEGRCEGEVAREARGAAGFGYDPLFIVAGLGRTMAELSEDEKNRISHRARAVQALRPKLGALLDARAAEARRIAER